MISYKPLVVALIYCVCSVAAVLVPDCTSILSKYTWSNEKVALNSLYVCPTKPILTLIKCHTFENDSLSKTKTEIDVMDRFQSVSLAILHAGPIWLECEHWRLTETMRLG